jgi:hypothetical protein
MSVHLLSIADPTVFGLAPRNPAPSVDASAADGPARHISVSEPSATHDGRLIAIAAQPSLVPDALELPVANVSAIPERALIALRREGYAAVSVLDEPLVPPRWTQADLAAEAARSGVYPGGTNCTHPLLPGEFALVRPGPFADFPLVECSSCDTYALASDSWSCSVCRDEESAPFVMGVYVVERVVMLLRHCLECVKYLLQGGLETLPLGDDSAGRMTCAWMSSRGCWEVLRARARLGSLKVRADSSAMDVKQARGARSRVSVRRKEFS